MTERNKWRTFFFVDKNNIFQNEFFIIFTETKPKIIITNVVAVIREYIIVGKVKNSEFDNTSLDFTGKVGAITHLDKSKISNNTIVSASVYYNKRYIKKQGKDKFIEFK